MGTILTDDDKIIFLKQRDDLFGCHRHLLYLIITRNITYVNAEFFYSMIEEYHL